MHSCKHKNCIPEVSCDNDTETNVVKNSALRRSLKSKCNARKKQQSFSRYVRLLVDPEENSRNCRAP